MQTALSRPFTILLCAVGLACLAPVAALADIPFVTGVTGFGSKANNWGPGVGFRFFNATGTTITVTQLGRWVVQGNNRAHALSIYSTAHTQLATVTVNCAGATPGQFLYGTLSTPYNIAAGASVYFISAETSNGDYWYNNNNTVVTITTIGGIESAYDTDSSFNDTGNNGGAYTSTGPVSFQYTSPMPNWTKSGTVYTTDGSPFSVNSAIANASPGDIVNVPAGSFTWGASGTYVSVDKAIILKGAGIDTTIIHLSPSAGIWGNGTIRISAAGVVKGFTVLAPTSGNNATPFSTSGTGYIGWRITNVKYDGTGSHFSYFAYVGGNYGLIDNCQIIGGGGTNELIFMRGPTDSWTTAKSMGTANALYIEDCTYSGRGYLTDINANGRAVIRFNTITGPMQADCHMIETADQGDGTHHGARQMEVYGNHWTLMGGYWTAFDITGGTGVIFDNSKDHSQSELPWMGLYEYGVRSASGFWSTQTQFPLIAAHNYITPTWYPVPEQIGMGTYPQSSGQEPMYLINNTGPGGVDWPITQGEIPSGAITQYQTETSNGSATFTMDDIIKADRDYFKQTVGSTFNGSSGVGRGTKAQMLAITPTKTGAGFWVTDEGSWNTALPANTSGQLYVWNASAWVLKYTPYTYPHPLRTGVTPPPPTAAPSSATTSISIR